MNASTSGLPPLPFGGAPTRRRVLRTALGLGALSLPTGMLAGCTGDDEPGDADDERMPGSTPSPTPTLDPDLPVLSAALESERTLLATYAATTAQHPDLLDQLRTYVQRHEQHLAALTAMTRTAGAPTARVASSPTPTPTHVPSSPGEALAALLSLERAATTGRRRDTETVRGSEYARILASIAACEGTHVTAFEGESS